MDRRIKDEEEEVDYRSCSNNKTNNDQSTTTIQEGNSCSVTVPKKEINKEEDTFCDNTTETTTTVGGDSNDGNTTKVTTTKEENPSRRGEKTDAKTCGNPSITPTTSKIARKSDDNGQLIQNKVETSSSTHSSSTKNTTTAMSSHNNIITTICDNTASGIISPTLNDDITTTTSSSKTTVGGSDDHTSYFPVSDDKEKVSGESTKEEDNDNVHKSDISSSGHGANPKQQQVKCKDISNDGEIENKNLVDVGSSITGKDSVVVEVNVSSTTFSYSNSANTDVKMTSIVTDGDDIGKTGEIKDAYSLEQQKRKQQHDGPIVAVPPDLVQISCTNVPTEIAIVEGEEMQNEAEKTATSSSSSSLPFVANNRDNDNKGIIKNEDITTTTIDPHPEGVEKTTCSSSSILEQQQPSPFNKTLGSSDYNLSKDERKLISRVNNDIDKHVKVTGDDGSLNQIASQKNTKESSPVKGVNASPPPAAANPLNPVHKTDFPNQNNENMNIATQFPNESSGKIVNTVPESTLQTTSPSESILDKISSDSIDIMKPSTNYNLENVGNQLPSVNSGSPQTNTSITISSSPLKQPLEKVDDDLSRVTAAVSTAPIQTVQSSTDDSSKRFPSRDLVGASQTLEHSSSNSSYDKSSNNQCVQGQDDVADCSLLSKGSAELTNLSSARSEVPKKSEQDAAVRTATLSLGDTDEHSSKRSESDSQDVTPSDSLSIPSDRDLECVDIASLGVADNDTGAASLKVTKDGASSSSSSSVLSIYHLKWIHFKSKKVPVITQNENGPCPLLAIMNVLLLQGRVNLESGLELITSEQLMDHLDECILENVPKTASEDVQLNYQQNMQDGMAVIHKLQTGLDVNVRFTGVQDFEYTTECIIFDLLGISLYHGWLVDPQSHDVVSAIGMCSYNQLVEKIIVQKTSEDIKLFAEATIAENFLEKTASQLTYHGLCELSTTVKEGELCVFFRNNHFSTLYRHKNELFLLVTDQGFLNEFNVVWETLSSVEGDCYFVDAEFNTYTKPDPVSGNSVVTPPVVPIGSDQQIDQDYLVALSLEREQQLQREAWASHAGVGGGAGGLGAGAAVPDPLKGQHVQLTDLELAKKLQDEENQRAGAAAAPGGGGVGGGTTTRRNPRAAEACTSTGTRRTRDREKDKDSCLIL